MKTGDLFLSFEGRLNRERWLGAVMFLVALFIIISLISLVLDNINVISRLNAERVRIFTWVVLMVPWLVIDWKRFHDRGKWGVCALACPLGQALYAGAMHSSISSTSPLLLMITFMQIIIAAWYIYDLAYCVGESGANRYGVDPCEGTPVHGDY